MTSFVCINSYIFQNTFLYVKVIYMYNLLYMKNENENKWGKCQRDHSNHEKNRGIYKFCNPNNSFVILHPLSIAPSTEGEN